MPRNLTRERGIKTRMDLGAAAADTGVLNQTGAGIRPTYAPFQRAQQTAVRDFTIQDASRQQFDMQQQRGQTAVNNELALDAALRGWASMALNERGVKVQEGAFDQNTAANNFNMDTLRTQRQRQDAEYAAGSTNRDTMAALDTKIAAAIKVGDIETAQSLMALRTGRGITTGKAKPGSGLTVEGAAAAKDSIAQAGFDTSGLDDSVWAGHLQNANGDPLKAAQMAGLTNLNDPNNLAAAVAKKRAEVAGAPNDKVKKAELVKYQQLLAAHPNSNPEQIAMAIQGNEGTIWNDKWVRDAKNRIEGQGPAPAGKPGIRTPGREIIPGSQRAQASIGAGPLSAQSAGTLDRVMNRIMVGGSGIRAGTATITKNDASIALTASFQAANQIQNPQLKAAILDQIRIANNMLTKEAGSGNKVSPDMQKFLRGLSALIVQQQVPAPTKAPGIQTPAAEPAQVQAEARPGGRPPPGTATRRRMAAPVSQIRTTDGVLYEYASDGVTLIPVVSGGLAR